MDIVSNSLKKVDSTLSGVLSNPVYYGILAIFLAMYGPRLSPKLPPSIRNLFTNNYFRFIVILLIIYMSNNDLSLALIITIGFILVMSLANSQTMEENFTQNNKEGFSDFDSIREFYDEEEEFQDPPQNAPENNNEEFNEDEDVEDFAEEDENFAETFENPDEDFEALDEDFENPDEDFEALDEDFEEGAGDDEELFNPKAPHESFSDYEKNLRNIVETYKFNGN